MTRKHRVEKQNFVTKVKSYYGCRLCKENQLCCLSFHHLDKGTKRANIAKRLANFSMKLIREEINKCVVLCLNCHRKVENGLIEVGEEHLCQITESYRIK